MCGVVGILDSRRRRTELESTELLEVMATTMFNRGPDGSGTWVDEQAGIGFGHRRLAIIDLSEAGHQPMISADGRWVITFNGEIYDHDELRADLEATGVRFRGHSDTEVLVEGIARWGLVPTLQRLDGMFAIGLWDRTQRKLTLARDRMGEKPLYYGTLGNGEVVFASSLDAIAKHPCFDRRVDRDALTLFFRYNHIPSPYSIYQGIHKLEPGCTVEISTDGHIGEPQPYWSYFEVVERGVTFTGSAHDAVDELDRLLRRSVRRRMIADVPVGAFLSGGIDSSTVVAIAQEESSAPVHTFTIGNTDTDFDESSDARRVAAHLGTRHEELMVSESDMFRVVEQLGAMYDEPFADSSQIPTRLVSELARQHVTVALSGDAGDELFGGYNRYVWVPAIWRQLERVPMPVRSGAARIGERVPPTWWDTAALAIPKSRRPRMVGVKATKVLGVADCVTPYEVFNRLVSHWQSPADLVPGATEPKTVHSDASRWPKVNGIVEHMAAVDGVAYLPGDILTKVDRAAMSVSLETRIPLLDRHIIEFAAGLPLPMRIHDGQSKWLLRQVLERYVPAQMFDRPKAGFGIPIDAWMRGPLKDWAEHHLFGSDAALSLNQDLIRSTWDSHQLGRSNEGRKLWDVAMYAVWSEGR